MFENVKPPEDMFAGLEESKPSNAGSTPPRPLTTPISAPSPEAVSPPPSAVLEAAPSGKGFPWKPFVLVIAIVVVIAAAGGISFYILSSRTPATPGTPDVSDAVSEEPVAEREEEEEPAPVEEEPETPPRVIMETPKDTDKDGLTDEEETELGTSLTSTDTDADGLFDREEVEVYETNPLNPDTDADGYTDGDEVDNGYNPNGPGKLLEVPQN